MPTPEESILLELLLAIFDTFALPVNPKMAPPQRYRAKLPSGL
jgi:hypothetical protein